MTAWRDRPLPPSFREELAGREEVLVTSREAGREVTVPMTFALGATGHVYLMTSAFSRKARRWARDPWVRLTVARGAAGVEGAAVSITADDLAADDVEHVLERFRSAGAATPEALRELVASGTHLLVRVDGRAA